MVKNPVICSAFLCALLFYSGIAEVKIQNSFFTLAKKTEITKLEGYVQSNPVKTRIRDSYKADFCVKNVWTKNGKYSAGGTVCLFINSEIVERYYPGKLYTGFSGSQKAFLIENGSELILDVEPFFSNKYTVSYSVEDGKFNGWHGNFIKSRFVKFRALCRLQFKRLMYAWGKAGGFLLALLSGSREYTEECVSEGFRNAGLSHVLALSGMHLGLFGGIALYFGKKASTRNLADALQLAAILFFVWFAGLSPSLFRAFLASLILYLNSLLRMNRPDSLSLLSVCFIIHVIIFSSHIFEPAFMLSYSALAGIIIFSRSIRKIIPVIIPFKLRSSLSESAAANFSTIPVSICFFNKVIPVGIIATVIVSPLVIFFLYFGLLGILISLLFPFLSPLFNGIMNMLYLFIKNLVLFFG
ncbi:ComEC/Rec2 family competence protein [Treponema sp.]|uniref:ComEC/Rec2 family competence protein n=1 Tax=Treponema sp. TaxID=166 RepID=UPI00388E0EF4